MHDGVFEVFVRLIDVVVFDPTKLDSLSLALAGTGVYPSPLVVKMQNIGRSPLPSKRPGIKLLCETRLDSLVVEMINFW